MSKNVKDWRGFVVKNQREKDENTDVLTSSALVGFCTSAINELHSGQKCKFSVSSTFPCEFDHGGRLTIPKIQICQSCTPPKQICMTFRRDQYNPN